MYHLFFPPGKCSHYKTLTSSSIHIVRILLQTVQGEKGSGANKQLAYETWKAKTVVDSRDISYAFTNLIANDYYSFSTYSLSH